MEYMKVIEKIVDIKGMQCRLWYARYGMQAMVTRYNMKAMVCRLRYAGYGMQL